MDENVYAIPKIGSFFNNRFICVKLQMDQRPGDADVIRASYQEAIDVNNSYHVVAYPTCLFFDRDGRLVRREIGYTDQTAFLSLGADVLDTAKNYYHLIREFNLGKLNDKETMLLANTALSLGDSAQGEKIANSYIRKLVASNPFDRDKIRFIHENTKLPQDAGFAFFYKCQDTIDKIMEDDTYAQGVVTKAIIEEMIMPELKKLEMDQGAIPDWVTLQRRIEGKYGERFGEHAVIVARANWAGQHRDWEQWARYYVMCEEIFGDKAHSGIWVAYHLNSVAWTVFVYSKNHEALNYAAAWCGRAVLMDPEPNYIDTYANILYKLGKSDPAIAWESIAAKLSPTDEKIQSRFVKMKKGEPTWPEGNY